MCAMIEKLRMRSDVIGLLPSSQLLVVRLKQKKSISHQAARYVHFLLGLTNSDLDPSNITKRARDRTRHTPKHLFGVPPSGGSPSPLRPPKGGTPNFIQRCRSAPVAVCRCNQRKPTSIRRRYPKLACLLRDGHCRWLSCRRTADELQRQSLRR